MFTIFISLIELMKSYFTLLIVLIFPFFGMAQIYNTVKGKIVSSETLAAMESVNIVNLNQVIGTTTNTEGQFEIRAKANDTLHLSYLGYKSIKVKVSNDWIKYGTSTTIELTELALALEEVNVNKLKLTGYLEVDIKQVPIQKNVRYSISGLNSGYESSSRSPSMVTKVLGAIFNPADFLHNIFGKKPREMRKLREMLIALLQVDKIDLDLLISECNYSMDFIRSANDLQILDAISECYEEYKILSRNRRN